MVVASLRLLKRIHRDFPAPGDAVEAERLVSGAAASERVQAAAVIGAGGDLTRLRDLAALARLDWRDLLVGTGFADRDWPLLLDEHLGPK